MTMLTKSIANYDYTPVLSAADVPVLLIREELDKEINATLSSTLAAIDRLPHGRVVSLADAGHFANMEQPQEFNRMLEGFLEQAPVYILIFILTRDAMTPMGLWEIGATNAFWLRFTAPGPILVILGTAFLLSIAGLAELQIVRPLAWRPL